MNRHWRKPIAALAPIAAVTGLVWLMAGAPYGLGLGLVLVATLLAHQIFNLAQFREWLLAPRIETLPAGSGVWEQIFSKILRMQKQQARTEANLQEALTRFQKAGEAMPEAVVILDQDNAVEWCNPRSLTYFGLDATRDRGHQVTNLLRQPSFVEYLRHGDFSQPLNIRVPTGGTHDSTISVQIVPYGDREKLLLGRDITRWEKLETMRRDFVANVSHELRTPLTVLTGFLETLQDLPHPDPEMTHNSIRLMAQQATRMSRLVEDLLTLSRLESTNAPIREEDVNVCDLAQQLYQDAMALSGGRHDIRLVLETDAGLHGNADELRSAFGNLVSNAIRYTPERGRVEIHWELRQGVPVFRVSDTGIGIEEHHIDRLTERFYRVDRSRSRETGGTGLGLAIVKHVLSRHQARLDIQSVPGRGSAFLAVFPESRYVEMHRIPPLARTGS
ncbi:MAG: phosphate regulon sensor histidine kinase PhoR [Burkholderiales bacterium]